MKAQALTEELNNYITDVCIAPNAIDYIAIVDLELNEEEVDDLIIFNSNKSGPGRNPDINLIKKIIEIEHNKYKLLTHDMERIERYDNIIIAWSPLEKGVFLVLASESAAGEPIFRMAVKDERKHIREKYLELKQAMKLKN